MSPSTSAGSLRALLSRTALRSNLVRLREQGSAGPPDLRGDAWGHGAGFVTSVAGEGAEHGDASLLDNEKLLGLSAGFAPVMTLLSTVLSVKALKAGEGVSYGLTHRAVEDTTVALVAGGYAQGVLRALGNRAAVRIGDRRHPIVGRVAMDVCVVDLGGADVAPGAEVRFFGPELPIARWSVATGLTTGELVAAVGQRVAREVIE